MSSRHKIEVPYLTDAQQEVRGAGTGWQVQIEKAIIEKTTPSVHIGAKGVVNWVDLEVRLALSHATGAADYPC